MTRTIKVTSVGSASAKADYVILSLRYESNDLDYDKAIELNKQKVSDLNSILSKIGYKANDLKTCDFNIKTEYKNVKDIDGNYKAIFVGYHVIHDLKLTFDFNKEYLSKTINAISKSKTNPNLKIAFTVKDLNKIKNEVLKDACKNAKEKALILTKEANVKLASLISIDYSFNETNLVSDTEVNCLKSCINIDPQDVTTSDRVTFVWEIL